MDATPRRRWFRFSVRAVLIGVAVLSVLGSHVVHEWRIVRERDAVWRSLKVQTPTGFTCFKGKRQPDSVNGVSYTRQLLGDQSIASIQLGLLPEEEVQRLRAAFPEAAVTVPERPGP